MNIQLKIKHIPPGGSHIFVEGKILNEKMIFLIDTGASKSVIDKNYIDEHLSHIQVKEVAHATTGLGATYEKSVFAIIPEIEIGKFKLPKINFGVLDLSIINTAYTAAGMKPIRMIIGGDILLKYQSVINYKKRILQLYK